MSALFIAISKITDRDKLNEYLKGAPATLAGRQMELLAYTESAEDVEGAAPGSRVVVMKFPDKAAAMDCYNSAGYQAVAPLRQAGTEGFAIVCDGM